ncbi:MAG: alpha-L-fucosidase [Alphaproteobacteria bacterium]|nr:alpha-L-fucosidase [Alphaproteobacteria bacterium]
MGHFIIGRRDLLAGAAAAPLAAVGAANAQPPPGRDPSGGAADADQQRRMKWWHDAKFGMFIHFGLYAAHGRHEWAMEDEAIPVAEYQRFTEGFKPAPGSPRKWAQLAKAAGMKYMVLTSKHHEGFCNWDTKLTNYNAAKFGPRRDLIAEYVEAARAEGMRVGFYYSLMDWHHPDGARCATDEAARRRFVDYTHGLIRELLTNYGKIDILWYDVSWPLDAAGWESEKMNRMVFGLQPDIIVNNRNKLPGDFSTPEQTIKAEEGGRAWESCMTLNDSWGYQRADDNWKTPRTVIRNLITCARDGGNYLLNIGPQPDGGIPPESERILRAAGEWVHRHGETIYGADRCRVARNTYANFTRKGNTLYMHVHFWPGSDVAISGLRQKVLSAKLMNTGQSVAVAQDGFRTHLTGLPATAPDSPVTTIALECDGEPVQDTDYVRINKPRAGVGI